MCLDCEGMRTSERENNIFLPFNALHYHWNDLEPTEKFETLKAVAGMKSRLPFATEQAIMEDKIRKNLLLTPRWSRHVDYEPPNPPIKFPQTPFYPNTKRNFNRFGRHRKVYNYDPFFERNKSKSQTFLDAIGEEENYHSRKDYALLKNRKVKSTTPSFWSNANDEEDRLVFDDDTRSDRSTSTSVKRIIPLSITDRPHNATSESKKLPVIRYRVHNQLKEYLTYDDGTVERGSQGFYAGPLSEWQRTADNFIDSELRQKTRKRFTGKTNLSTLKLSHSEENLPQLVDPVKAKEAFDSDLGISKKKRVLKRPTTNIGSFSRFLSKISPFPTSANTKNKDQK